MSFREQSLLSRHEVTWDRDAIDAVRVAVEEHVGDESVTYEHFIEVIADTGRPRHWFSHRDKRELEWLVHKIQEALGLDASETGRSSSKSAELQHVCSHLTGLQQVISAGFFRHAVRLPVGRFAASEQRLKWAPFLKIRLK